MALTAKRAQTRAQRFFMLQQGSEPDPLPTPAGSGTGTCSP